MNELKDFILLVKIFDCYKTYLGKGYLEKIEESLLYIKGANLPKIPKDSKVFINVYNDLSGVTTYECKVQLGAEKQLTAVILHKHKPIERRNSLKVKTDFTIIPSFIRRDNNLIEHQIPVKISVQNLSVGGMRFFSETEFQLGDLITIVFDKVANFPVTLTAKVVRIDQPIIATNDSIGYGCKFQNMSKSTEEIVCKYLFERQLYIYRKHD